MITNFKIYESNVDYKINDYVMVSFSNLSTDDKLELNIPQHIEESFDIFMHYDAGKYPMENEKIYK